MDISTEWIAHSHDLTLVSLGPKWNPFSGASNDKSWYYVIDSTGQSGYIPRNYVLADKTGEGFVQHIDMVRDRVR